MKRRGFLAMLAAWLTPRPTTTLSAAPPDASTTINLSDPFDTDGPFLVLEESISMEEFERQYIAPAVKAYMDELDRQVLHCAMYGRGFVRVQLDPGRLPE